MGLHEFDGELGENDAETHLIHRRLLETTLAEIENLPDDAFTGDGWLDRRGMLALLRTELFFNRRERWRINPQVHCDTAINCIFSLLVQNADHLEKAVKPIESRLAAIPRYLGQGAACVRRPVPLWTKLAIKSCEGAQTFLSEIQSEIVSRSKSAPRCAKLFKDAIAAFRDYATALERKAPGPANGYSVGSDGFDFLIRERTGLPYTGREVQARGNRLIARLTEELRAEARKFGKKKTSQILEEAAAQWTPQAPSLLEEYQRVNGAVRAKFEKAGLVTFPKGERCRVMLVPSFLRNHFPTAAYRQPGQFDKDQTGIFWVNDLSLEQRDPEKRAAEIRQHFGLEFTCAHEAYPGHHLQFCVQNQHRSKLRRLFHHAIFYEGWTLWCEKMAVDEGVIELPQARLIQLHDALWRAYRIGIDCGLHDGSLTYAAACQRLQYGVGFTAARARGDVNWYTSSPTVPMSYLLGRLEVERLHAHLVKGEGWSLKKFNDWMLGFGAIPWRWIWDAKLRAG